MNTPPSNVTTKNIAAYPCVLQLAGRRTKLIKEIVLLAIALSILIMLTACGKGALDCSSSDVKAAVLRQFRSQLESNPSIFTLFIIEKSTSEIKNIRTTDRSERGARCLADIDTYFVARPEAIQAQLRSSGNAVNPVKYILQLTDDDDVYVTMTN